MRSLHEDPRAEEGADREAHVSQNRAVCRRKQLCSCGEGGGADGVWREKTCLASPGSPSAGARVIQKQPLPFRGEMFLREGGCCWGERAGSGWSPAALLGRQLSFDTEAWRNQR